MFDSLVYLNLCGAAAGIPGDCMLRDTPGQCPVDMLFSVKDSLWKFHLLAHSALQEEGHLG